MPKASELKKGDVVEHRGAPHIIKQIDTKSPSSRGANTLYKIRMNHAKTGQKVDCSLKGDELLPDIDFERRKIIYSYMAGGNFIFMDELDYNEMMLTAQDLAEDSLYIIDGLEPVIGLMVDQQLMGIELPKSVVMTIADTSPGIKGNSTLARAKPATMTTGLIVQVPEYLEPGDQIKINTDNGSFMSRG